MPDTAVRKGAALEYTAKILDGPIVERDKSMTLSGPAVVVAQGNGDRVGLVLINLGTVPLFVAPNSAVSASFGIALPAGGGALSLVLTEDFTLMTREWYGTVSGAGSGTLYVLEYVRFTVY